MQGLYTPNTVRPTQSHWEKAIKFPERVLKRKQYLIEETKVFRPKEVEKVKKN